MLTIYTVRLPSREVMSWVIITQTWPVLPASGDVGQNKSFELKLIIE